jgi:hypothetical protein
VRRRLFTPVFATPLLNEVLEPRMLLAAGIRPTARPSDADLSVTLGSYHTYTSATTDLQSFASTYPNLTG